MTKMVFVLNSAQIRKNAMTALLDCPDGMQVTIAKKSRSLDQNAKFHAICGDLAKYADHMGRRFDLEQWKNLLVSAHAIETKTPFDPICGLAGEFLNIRESTAAMTSERKSSLIEYALSVCAEKGVKIRD